VSDCSLNVNAGMKTLEIPADYHEMKLLQIQQKDNNFTGKVVCN
jgi:hypothetical protein